MDELEDAVTTDLLTEVSRGVDKWLWFVEAHQQGAPSEVVSEDGEPRRAPRKGTRRGARTPPRRANRKTKP